MGHYKSNLRDIEFNLFELLGRQEVLGRAPYTDLDVSTARHMLQEVERLAVEDLAASFLAADRTPPVFDPATNSVTVPDALRASYRAYVDAGWTSIDLPSEMGGTPTPPSLRWAIGELILGANPAVHMYASGPAFSTVLHALGTEEQKRWAMTWARRGWGGTMVLTEPDAGSDVGAGRTKAVRQPDGSWHLFGVKRFITSGEHDLEENIVHLVLARPDRHGPGTKGLSLFVVPKYLPDWETGELLDRNGVYATNVEKKMGLKASATCELTFGERRPARGWLLGEVHDGIAQMFKVIEAARMMVGTKAMATLSTGYLNALDYAKSRVQGADLTRMADKAAPRVTITHHPDVRRSLLTQKAYAEGLRSLVLFTASVQDEVAARQAAGEDASSADRLNDLLLPLVKGYGSEKSYALLGAESLQCLGGSGYLQDYPLEQYIRDSKIDTLYEGTTAIQGMDFFFRKIVRDRGQALTSLVMQIQEFTKSDCGGEALAAERDLLAQGLDDVQGIVGSMVAALTAGVEEPLELYKVGQNTTRLLMAAGDLVVGWLLLRGAGVALARLEAGAGRDEMFYRGKVAAATFFAATVLPQLAAARASAEGTRSIMDLPEDAL